MAISPDYIFYLYFKLMRIYVVAVGQRMPSWVQEAVKEYSKRMPAHCRVETKEISAQHRGKNADLRRIHNQFRRDLFCCVEISNDNIGQSNRLDTFHILLSLIHVRGGRRMVGARD